MKTKLTALILTAVLSLSLMGTALAETDPCAAFRDVNRSAWYHTALDYVVKNKLMSELVFEQCPDMPKEGDTFRYGNLEITVLSMKRSRIYRLKVRPLEEPEKEGGEDA